MKFTFPLYFIHSLARSVPCLWWWKWNWIFVYEKRAELRCVVVVEEKGKKILWWRRRRRRILRGPLIYSLQTIKKRRRRNECAGKEWFFLRKFLFIKFSTTCIDKRIKVREWISWREKESWGRCRYCCSTWCQMLRKKWKFFSIMHKPSTVCCDFSWVSHVHYKKRVRGKNTNNRKLF